MMNPDSWPPPARRRIYLMRHGDVEYFNPAGKPHRPETVPLTEHGQEQARAAGVALAEVPIDRTITSGLRRTDETARLVVAGRPVPIDAEPRFREIEAGRMSEWEAAPPTVVRRVILFALGEEMTPESRFLAGETIASCQKRVSEAWDELLARRDWATVLIVAHGVVNRLLLAHCLGMPLASLGKVEQDAACINLVEMDDAGLPHVRLINHTAHDPGKRTLKLTTLEGLYDQYLRGRRTP
jgi:probable phosphoglycerate mutase